MPRTIALHTSLVGPGISLPVGGLNGYRSRSTNALRGIDVSGICIISIITATGTITAGYSVDQVECKGTIAGDIDVDRASSIAPADLSHRVSAHDIPGISNCYYPAGIFCFIGRSDDAARTGCIRNSLVSPGCPSPRNRNYLGRNITTAAGFGRSGWP